MTPLVETSPPVPGSREIRDAIRTGNLKVLLAMIGSLWRGFVRRTHKQGPSSAVATRHPVHFTWAYERDGESDFHRLYDAAKRDQWDGARSLAWDTPVDPLDPAVELIPGELLSLDEIAAYRKLPDREKRVHRHSFLAWMLSQFLHGEQGALYAACQVTEAIADFDGKLFGSTQVVDEGRHVEVFHRYLADKLGKVYAINDNLYVLIDALMSDSRWDMKFLGMQIMIEGLALGAFGVLRRETQEPLLQQMLAAVIKDEARHVHYGVVALEGHVASLSEAERREREDWAYEVAVLMRDRFLAHEFYEEFYGHCMTRKAWDRLVLASGYMARFRKMMFRRLVPNLKRIRLLSDRIRPYYASLGLLEFEAEKAAPELSADELLVA